MKNDIAIRNKTAALTKAKEELASFKQNRLVTTDQKKANALAAAKQPKTSYLELWCTKQQGGISRLEFELTKDKAKATGAVKITSGNNNGHSHTQHQSNEKAEFMQRELVFGWSWDGCLHCGNYGFVFCNNCETLSCWDNPEDGWHECPNCENGARVGKSGITIKIEKTKPSHALTGQKQNKALPKPKGKGLMLPPRR